MSDPAADAVVLFGASGDLSRRELFPALHALARRREIPPIVGTSRAAWDDDDLVQHARSGVEEFGGGVDPAAFDRLADRLKFVGGDLADRGLYRRLAAACGGARHPLHYLSIPPALFDDAVRGLMAAGLNDGARIVVEKPFGRDLDSARRLSAALRRAFPEEAVYRIDHFLGLDTVRNILVLRFANEILEPVWNCHHVAAVQLTMAEVFGVGGRGAFYETVGAVRDVVQNHLLQVVILAAMEPPPSAAAAALRDAKVQLLRAVQPVGAGDVVRGQYATYRSEDGVAPDSLVETFAALRLAIDNRRWAGVPFHIRAGKKLPTTATELVVEFTRPPAALFAAAGEPHPNHLRLEIFPGDAVSLRLQAKAPDPGAALRSRPVDLAFDPSADARPLAYEPLLAAALDGDPALFAREDGVMEAWRVVQPALDAGRLHLYDDGTWGPERAGALAPPGGWHDPVGV